MLKKGYYFIKIALLSVISQGVAAHSITLKQAEIIALKRSSEIKGLLAQRRSFEEKAIADGQLADPKLGIGFANIPTNSFSFTQEPMTQIQLGIEQMLPKGSSLKYKYLGMHHSAAAKKIDAKVMSLKILQKVRASWLNLAFWLNIKTIYNKELKVFENLVGVTQSMLANNKTQQKDVILANLELLEVKNTLIGVSQSIRVARSELSRWVGKKNAKLANPAYMPNWRLKSKKNIYFKLKSHPILKSDLALIKSKKDKVQLQKEQFKPGFSIGGGYGFRQGNNVNGSKKSDFLQIKFGVSLPLFPSNRQSRQLKASQLNVFSQEALRVSHLRDLYEILHKNLDIFKLKQRSANLYQSNLISESKQYATSTLNAYENTQTDFPTLARAYIKQFNTELGFVKTLRDRTEARINLLFIQGR